MTKEFEFNDLIPALQAIARRVGQDGWVGVSEGWLLRERARRSGREVSPAWIFVATRRILERSAIPTSSLSLDSIICGRPLHEVVADDDNVIEKWRTIELDPQAEKMLSTCITSSLAKMQGKTQRAVQQQLCRQIARFKAGDLFFTGGG